MTDEAEYAAGLPRPDRDKLFAALAKAQGTIQTAHKDKTNPHFGSAYADLAAVWDACREALSSNGLSVIQTTAIVGQQLVLVTTLGHTSGQFVEGRFPITPDKQTLQGVGSALTYARRYALSAIIGVAPDDDDGEHAVEKAPTTKQTGKARKPAAKANAKAAAAKAEGTPPIHAWAYQFKDEIKTAEDTEALEMLVESNKANIADLKKESEGGYNHILDCLGTKAKSFEPETTTDAQDGEPNTTDDEPEHVLEPPDR